jgi:type I restriction enzyme M protein
MTDAHRQWIEERYHKGWKSGFEDEHVKLFREKDFAFHKVKVVFWQTDEHDQPAIITEPYEKALTATNMKKEQDFYDSGLTFRVCVRTEDKEKTVEFVLQPGDSFPAIWQATLAEAETGRDGSPSRPQSEVGNCKRRSRRERPTKGTQEQPEIVSVEWTHRHYVQDDEYIPHGEEIEVFLDREIAKPIIRWADSPQLGYEILPNKYFYRYQPPTPAKDLLAEFWKLEKEAEKMLEGLTR